MSRLPHTQYTHIEERKFSFCSGRVYLYQCDEFSVSDKCQNSKSPLLYLFISAPHFPILSDYLQFHNLSMVFSYHLQPVSWPVSCRFHRSQVCNELQLRFLMAQMPKGKINVFENGKITIFHVTRLYSHSVLYVTERDCISQERY